MSISEKTRKRLWAKSGNRCAISKIELICDPTGESNESNIEEECHIHARKPGGVRYNEDLSPVEVDEYENWILLSRNCHKQIDDNPLFWTSEKLREIKRSHEEWVKNTLDFEIRNVKSKKNPDSEISFLTRIITGSDLLNTISGCHSYDFDNDELKDEAEVELVGAFLQNAQDWGEILPDIESGERVRIKYHLSQALQELEDNGLWVFGGVFPGKIKIGKEVTSWRISVLRVLRSNNPTIISVGRTNSDELELPVQASDPIYREAMRQLFILTYRRAPKKREIDDLLTELIVKTGSERVSAADFKAFIKDIIDQQTI